MSFKFSAKHIEDFQFENLSKEQVLIIAIEAAKSLKWDIGHISNSGFIAYTKFSMSSFSEEVTIKINNNSANIKSVCVGTQIVDWGKNKENIKKFISSFNSIKNSLSIEDVNIKYEELCPNILSEEDYNSKPQPLSTRDKLASIFSIFIPVKGYFVTPIIININIAIFIIMSLTGVNLFLPDNESLIQWGANFKLITLSGEWWRIITNCFLHIGIFHLLMNMIALLYIGLLLEPYLGRIRFAIAYLLTGITASLISLYWNDLIISAGASGAIFGMYGVFLAMLSTNLIEKSSRKALFISIAVFVGYNLLNGLKGGIDNAAHIGGLLSGTIIGFVYFPSLKNTNNKNLKYITVSIVSVLFLISSFIIYYQIPNDIVKYEEKMQKFISMESMALEVYKMPDNTPKENLMKLKTEVFIIGMKI